MQSGQAGQCSLLLEQQPSSWSRSVTRVNASPGIWTASASMGACDGRGRISTSSWTFEPYDTSRPEALQENLCLNIQCRCTHELCIVNCDLVSIKGHDLPSINRVLKTKNQCWIGLSLSHIKRLVLDISAHSLRVPSSRLCTSFLKLVQP
jgi:hypothetical protein